MSKLCLSLLGTPDVVQLKWALKRAKDAVKTVRKRRGNKDTEQGGTRKNICSAPKKASY